jgi:hypothetical protein
MRSAMTDDDFYTLIFFARRSAVTALRANDFDTARLAMVALAVIDSARVDPRDILWAAAIARHTMHRVNPTTEAARSISAAAELAEPDTAQLLRRFRTVKDRDLRADWAMMDVRTPELTGFVEVGDRKDLGRSLDLLGASLRLMDVVSLARSAVSRLRHRTGHRRGQRPVRTPLAAGDPDLRHRAGAPRALGTARHRTLVGDRTGGNGVRSEPAPLRGAQPAHPEPDGGPIAAAPGHLAIQAGRPDAADEAPGQGIRGDQASDMAAAAKVASRASPAKAALISRCSVVVPTCLLMSA